jgi:hypothetical protein
MRNLWANNISRNPSIGMYGDFGFVNNVVFNWWNRSADGGDHHSLFNFINNYYKPGPITPKDKPIAYRILKPEAGRDSANKSSFGKAYVNGNIVEGYDKVTADNWAGGVQVEDNNGGAGRYEQAIRVNEPMPMAELTILPAKQAYDYVLDNVGATLPKRDAVDNRIIETVKTGKIFYTEGGQTGIGKQFIKRRLPGRLISKASLRIHHKLVVIRIQKAHRIKMRTMMVCLMNTKGRMALTQKDASDAMKRQRQNGYSNIEDHLNSLVNIKNVMPVATINATKSKASK